MVTDEKGTDLLCRIQYRRRMQTSPAECPPAEPARYNDGRETLSNPNILWCPAKCIYSIWWPLARDDLPVTSPIGPVTSTHLNTRED